MIAMGIGFAETKEAATPHAARKKIVVSIMPQIAFVKAIAGERAQIMALLPPGASEAYYDPTPEQLQFLSNADVYMMVGHLPFERTNLNRFRNINPGMLIVNMSQNLPLRRIEDDMFSKKKKGAFHTHHPEELDPHIWLSPRLVMKQAERIAQTLSGLDPAFHSLYEKNKTDFVQKLERLDSFIQKQIGTPSTSQNKIVVYHPFLGYFCDDYGLKQISIEVEGKEPTSRYMNHLIKFAKENKIRGILAQRQFGKSISLTLSKEFNGMVIEFDPLGPDYISNMEQLGESVAALLYGKK